MHAPRPALGANAPADRAAAVDLGDFAQHAGDQDIAVGQLGGAKDLGEVLAPDFGAFAIDLANGAGIGAGDKVVPVGLQFDAAPAAQRLRLNRVDLLARGRLHFDDQTLLRDGDDVAVAGFVGAEDEELLAGGDAVDLDLGRRHFHHRVVGGNERVAVGQPLAAHGVGLSAIVGNEGLPFDLPLGVPFGDAVEVVLGNEDSAIGQR